jgi:hypothetical protein
MRRFLRRPVTARSGRNPPLEVQIAGVLAAARASRARARKRVDRFIKAPVLGQRRSCLEASAVTKTLDASWAERAAARPLAVVDRHAASPGVTRAGNSVAVYLCNKSVPDPIGFAQLRDLSDLILDACE